MAPDDLDALTASELGRDQGRALPAAAARRVLRDDAAAARVVRERPRARPCDAAVGDPRSLGAVANDRVISEAEEWALVQRMVGALVGRYGARLSEETEEQARVLVFITLAGLGIT